MIIYKKKNYDELSRLAADIIASQILFKPDSILGLATGSTPEGLYKCLIDDYKSGRLDFSKIKTFNLDEYKGLSPEHDQSYRYFMNNKLFDHINIDKNNTHVPDGLNENEEIACQSYEEKIQRSGGIDIQVLGLGLNGHIGFNEPANEFKRYTNCVKLTNNTLEANSRFFNNDINKMPHYAYTMGIGTIMQADKILLLASGKSKAEILKRALTGPITPEVPASILQLHNNLYVIGDEESIIF